MIRHPKRVYRAASVVAAAEGFGVALDGKPVRTPQRAALIVPSRALAAAIAAEWEAQAERVRPETMRLTRLAATALDRVGAERAAVLEQVGSYGGTDLVCYRAEEPAALVAAQRAAWDPLLAWAEEALGARLVVACGVRPVEQPAAALAALRGATASFDAFRLAALGEAVPATGSLVVGLALLHGRVDAAAAFAACQVDEDFQIARWGEEDELSARRAGLRADLAATERFLRLL